MAETVLTPELLPAGADGFVLRFALTPEPRAMAAARSLADRLEAAPPPGTVEIAPALVSVLLRFNPARTDRETLAAHLRTVAQEIAATDPRMPEPSRRWTIPVSFGGENGPQLSDVATRLGMGEDAAIREICASELRVLTIGFAPGQPYIGLLPDAWHLPRLSELTPTVPAGAVVVAVRQIVLFGSASATGWRQIGRAAFRTFVPERREPMPLRGGDAIRFAPASAAEIDALSGEGDRMGGARLEVLR